jgi:peroxiredoxin
MGVVMRILVVLSLLVVSIIAIFSPAQANSADIGNRAVAISGWDIVNHRNVNIEDYLGQWVLLEFSAMWCGPCNRERPEFLKLIKPYRDSGKLALVMVSCDRPDTLPELKRMIAKYRVDFPVLYDGGMFDSIPVLEWLGGDSHGFGVPTAYLINPQGVIVASHIRSGNLIAMLDFFMQASRPTIGIRAYDRHNADGSVLYCAEVMNPSHQPIEVHLDLCWEEWSFDPKDPDRVAIDVDRHVENNYAHKVLEFSEFGEAAFQFSYKPAPNHDIIGYRFWVVYPGTAGSAAFGEKGLRLSVDHKQAYLPGIEYRDEKYHVLPD